MMSESESAATVSISRNGPYGVTGAQLIGADGEVIETKETFWLCRCGQSADKPFCDGSHKRAGFEDPGVHGAE